MLRSRTPLAQAQRELSEALERQAATDEVLRVISSSPGDLQPVFKTMLENAMRICEAKFGILFRFDDEVTYPIAMLSMPPLLTNTLGNGSAKPRAGQTSNVVQIEASSSQFICCANDRVPARQTKLGGART